jgi:hypothetical protein
LKNDYKLDAGGCNDACRDWKDMKFVLSDKAMKLYFSPCISSPKPRQSCLSKSHVQSRMNTDKITGLPAIYFTLARVCGN